MSPRPPLRLLADTEWLTAPAPPELVAGLGLTAGALAGIISAPGVGKTFVTMSVAAHYALGVEWLGHPVVAPKPVVYCVGEGQSAFPLRLAALRTQLGLQDTEPSGVWYVREAFSLLSADDVSAVLDGMREHLDGEAPGLVAIDPLAGFMAGGDENSTEDMSTVVAALNRIRTETGACVLVDHHMGWNAERERGSTVLRAALDVLYKLTQDDGALILECVKLRDGVMPEPLRLELRRVADSCVVDRASASETATQLTTKQQHVLSTLKAIVTDEPVPYSRWQQAAGAADATFYRASALLVRTGYVMKYGKGRSARYAPPGPLPPTSISPPPHLHEGGHVASIHLRGPIRARSGGDGDLETSREDIPPF